MSGDKTLAISRQRSFRLRAEARQVEYRARVLRVGWADHPHWLDAQAVRDGRNFVTPVAHAAALERGGSGKGVTDRTFRNMLASQAMCFNLFAPLAIDTDMASEVLRAFAPEIEQVRRIQFEYTPTHDVFGDQTGTGGVDCDLLVEADWRDGARGVITIETKFVEPEFSICGFRKAGRDAKGLAVCPDDVPVQSDHGACLYSSRKKYRYWDQTRVLQTLAPDTLSNDGCPFAGPEWQLWVNHTLAHAEAVQRGAVHARFFVCAPAQNAALLGSGVIERFRSRLRQPDTFGFMPLDDLLQRIAMLTATRGQLRQWSDRLTARYGAI